MPKTESKAIPGLPGCFAGDDGHIYVDGERRPEHFVSRGYLAVRLGNPRRTHRVQRLVCLAFHGPSKGRKETRHLNGIKTDNRPTNLAWGTAKDNAADRDSHGTTAKGEANGAAKLSDAQVIEIRASRERGIDLANRFGVSANYISMLRHGKWRRALLAKMEESE